LRAYPGERAIIDAKKSNLTTGAGMGIDDLAQNIYFWDIEFTNTDTTVRSTSVNSNIDNVLSNSQVASNIHLINCIVHDAGNQGIGWFGTAGSEIYGCLVYYNGTLLPNQNHGLYMSQLNSPPQVLTVRDNIFFNSLGYCMHGYVTNLPGIESNNNFEGNTMFAAGYLGSGLTKQGSEMLFGTSNAGSALPGPNNRIDSNYIYGGPGPLASTVFNFGYFRGLIGPLVVTNNFVIGGAARFINTTNTNMTMTGNTFWCDMFEDVGAGAVQHFPTAAQWPGNTINDGESRPGSGNNVFIRKNRYEYGRANITIFNWDHANTVAVDISSVIKVGDQFALYYAPYFNVKQACLTGTYGGGTIAVPMTTGVCGNMPAPVFWPTPASMLPEFGAYIIQTTKRNS
jgi:hypothetical protein